MKIIQKYLFAVVIATFTITAVDIGTSLVNGASAQERPQISSAKAVVDLAKTQRLAGEQLDGYIGFVREDVSAEVRAAVNEINITRKSIYTKTANERNVTVSDVAGLMGEKLIAKAAVGEMVKLADMQWHPVG